MELPNHCSEWPSQNCGYTLKTTATALDKAKIVHLSAQQKRPPANFPLAAACICLQSRAVIAVSVSTAVQRQRGRYACGRTYNNVARTRAFAARSASQHRPLPVVKAPPPPDHPKDDAAEMVTGEPVEAI